MFLLHTNKTDVQSTLKMRFKIACANFVEKSSALQPTFKKWELGLSNHPNKEFADWIVESIHHGFKINFAGKDSDLCKSEINLPMSDDHRQKFFEKFICDIEKGIIQPIRHRPKYVCPLGVVPKDEDSVRIIRHFSFSNHTGKSINECIPDNMKAVRLPTIQDISRKIMQEGSNCYAFALDLKTAFRQLPIRKEDCEYLGYKWDGVYFRDLRAADGLATAPKMCQGIGEALIHVVETLYLPENCKGKLVIYIDDIIGVHKDKEVAELILRCVRQACDDLGVVLNELKLKTPAKISTLLGVAFNTIEMTCGIDEKKLKKYRKWLSNASTSKSLSREDLEKGIGYLNWVAQLMFPGKAFLRRLRNAMYALKANKDRCFVDNEMRKDLRFWIIFIDKAKDIKLLDLLKKHEYTHIIESDASTGFGIGAFMEPNYIMLETPSNLRGANIAVLEILAITLAITTWIDDLQHSAFIIKIDNTVAAYGLRDWSSRNTQVMSYIRLLAILAIENDFRFYVKWVPTDKNSVADAISRNKLEKFKKLVKLRGQFVNTFPDKIIWDKRVC